MLKQFFKDQVISPRISEREKMYRRVAVVTKIDEISNLCSIQYIDKEDNLSNKDNVPVRIYDPGIQSWFPEVGEEVVVEDYLGALSITGILPINYADNARSELSMDNDILSDNIGADSCGGYVY